MIFQSNIVKTVVQISCLREIIYTVETINPRVHDIISNISVETGTEISVVDNLTGCALKIEGGSQDVENARLQILLKLDSLFGLQNSDCQLRFQMQPLVCGKQRDQLLQLQFTNDVYLYLPIAYTLDSTENSYYDTVYISGNSLENINQTILCLKDKTMELETSIIQKKVVLSPRKMEWLFHHKKLQVRKICRDNAVTIQFPKVNSNNTNTVIFTGFNNNLVNRAIRMVKLLLCEYYVMSIQTATQFESLEQFQKYCSQLQLLIFPIFTKYNVEILVHKNIIEICGSSHDCQQAYLTMTNFDMIKIRDTKVQVELAFEHKDFINGKKNGKINRIIKQSGCRITFQENPSEINMIIDLYSPQPQQLIQGLGMLEEELPAEMSFYVPELYHKRIIGVAGKNIQKIMKRFGVYVKFSNTAEFELLCGYYENRDNVICRTPAKNKENLTDLKATILEVVNNPDLNEVESTVLVPRQLFNIVFGDGILKEQVYERFKHVLSFPDNEQGSDRVLLFGPEHLAQNAIDFIKV